MVDHLPIRPTITQDLSPKVLPDVQSTKILTGYVVISNPASISPTKVLKESNSNKEINIPAVINPYRQSIKQIKDELQEKNKETALNRKIIQEKTAAIQKSEAQVKRFEEKVATKKKELAALAEAEKEANLQLSDINIDLEKILKYYQSKNSHEVISLKSMEYMEKTSEVKRQQNYLATLREDSKKLTKETKDKERTLSNLQIQLKQLKNEAISEYNDKKAKISEKRISQEVLRSRLDNRASCSKKFGKEEKKLAEEIKKIIVGLTNPVCNKTKLEEMLIKSQEISIEKEQELSNLTYFYEDKRSEIVSNHRKKKDEISKSLKQLLEHKEWADEQKNTRIEENLKDKINKIRRQVIEFLVPEGEIQRYKLKYEVFSS